MTAPAPLTSAEARQLSRYLGSLNTPPGTLTFTALKGFLFAMVCGPTWVHSEEWLPLVFAGREPQFDDDQQRQSINQFIERLYLQIEQEVLAGKAKLPNNCRLQQPWQDNFHHSSHLKQWCDGFLQGHMGLIDWWEDYLAGDEELQEALGMAVIILGFYSDHEESLALAKMAFGDDADMKDLTESMRGYMPEALRSYQDIGQQLYQEHADDQELRQLRREIDDYESFGHNIVPFPIASDSRDQRWQAKQLVFAAWECSESHQRIDIANEALALDANCVDAYLILANEAARNRKEVLRLLTMAMEVAERELGDALVNDRGHFWALHETRPYMRARMGVAEAMWDLGQREEAMAHFHALLELNPEDNQGVRYQLLSHYIEMQQPEKARLILEQYQEDSAHWIYSDALLAFWQLGDCRQTRFLRRKAAKCNPHVIDFLISARHLPKALPDRFNDGSEEEAIIYTWYNRKLWQAVPEALDWLQSSWH